MKKIKSVSFPRSGHHLLVRCLLKYFANDPYHLDDIFLQDSYVYANVLQGGEMFYCENYIHCNKYPECTEEKVNFQKTHDNDGDFSVSINPEHNYIVQYRHPIESIVSLYMWGKYNGNKEYWENFALEQAIYYKIFIKKWVVSDINNRLLVNYNALINTPEIELNKIVRFITDDKVNKDLITKIVEYLNIEPKNNIKKFKYYDKDFFNRLETIIRNNI